MKIASTFDRGKPLSQSKVGAQKSPVKKDVIFSKKFFHKDQKYLEIMSILLSGRGGFRLPVRKLRPLCVEISTQTIRHTTV
jgi:hypothetical protein